MQAFFDVSTGIEIFMPQVCSRLSEKANCSRKHARTLKEDVQVRVIWNVFRLRETGLKLPKNPCPLVL